ncbi:hypothetical protein QG37_00837 [Candidozyma auris]|uniref:Uncharacterized protein n=1 Tax=Candidozyma auris TaxID=498019 RepID=A0A0L0P758_CANAR|nr:hypothetical protein QG37_00837 [[Candida] auris]
MFKCFLPEMILMTFKKNGANYDCEKSWMASNVA